jgi:aminoacylase
MNDPSGNSKTECNFNLLLIKNITKVFFYVFVLVPCVDFLRKLAKELELKFQVVHPASITKPVVIISVIGAQPELKSILLNSHMDVVPVFEEFWTHKPFAADIDDEGKIFARGAQDMKCVAMQYLGAIRSLKKRNTPLKRSIHVVFVPGKSTVSSVKLF